jgi:hypothetical protein
MQYEALAPEYKDEAVKLVPKHGPRRGHGARRLGLSRIRVIDGDMRLESGRSAAFAVEVVAGFGGRPKSGVDRDHVSILLATSSPRRTSTASCTGRAGCWPSIWASAT